MGKMDNITKLKKLLLLMEKQNNYFYIHGGDILVSFFTLIIAMFIFSYISLKKKQHFYKKNWPKYKCEPSITPFAGFLNPPPGSNFEEKMDFTLKNYAMCNATILKSNVGLFTKPIGGFQKMMAGLIIIALSGLNFIRTMFDVITKHFMKFIGLLLGKFFNILIALQVWLANLKDTFWKTGAVMINMLFFSIGTLYTAMSFLNNLLAVVIIILAIITVVSLFNLALIWIVPWFGIPSYIAWSIAYITTATPFIIVAIFAAIINNVVSKSQCDGDPNCCFHGDTKLKTERGIIKMKDIVVGDKLDKNVVHSIMKVNAGEPLYKLNNVLVSGNHYFYCKKNGYIKVKDSKQAKISNIKPKFYYCLLTSTKEITINNTLFCDWDDLDITDIMQIKNKYNIDKIEDLNHKFNTCLHPDTIICMKNNKINNK